MARASSSRRIDVGVPSFLGFMLGLFFFAGVGNASTFKQMPMISAAPAGRRRARLDGGHRRVRPFVFAASIGTVIAAYGSARPFFIVVAVFYAVNIPLNWWFYARKGAERPC